MISHVRDAHADAAEILGDAGAATLGGVIHCFSGGVDDARRYLDLGQYLSFSGILTFKNAAPIREAAAFAPARPHPGRDRRALPGAHPLSRQAQRAGVRGQDAGDAGRRAGHDLRGSGAADHRQRPAAVPARQSRRLTPPRTRQQYCPLVQRDGSCNGSGSAALFGSRHLRRAVRAERHPRWNLPRQPLAARRGEVFRFEVQLSTGVVALAGEGKVIWVKPFDAAEPQKPHGMGVQFVQIDPGSRETLTRILQAKAQPARARAGSCGGPAHHRRRSRPCSGRARRRRGPTAARTSTPTSTSPPSTASTMFRCAE